MKMICPKCGGNEFITTAHVMQDWKVDAMVCIISAFFIGKNVGAAGSMDKKHIDPAEIVDWNTDGKELSISTADGYEYYAYKKKTCYEKVNKKRQERILAEKMAISCNQK